MNINFTELVRVEIEGARKLHPRTQVSLHHGYAIILEELDEFWEQVKLKRHDRNPPEMLKELVQIAAMAQRTAEDIVSPLIEERRQLDEANRPPTLEEIEEMKRRQNIEQWCQNHPAEAKL